VITGGAVVADPAVPYELPKILVPRSPTSPQTETITKIATIPQTIYDPACFFASGSFPLINLRIPKINTSTARLTRIGMIELIVLEILQKRLSNPVVPEQSSV
jgi:hypothetical protein